MVRDTLDRVTWTKPPSAGSTTVPTCGVLRSWMDTDPTVKFRTSTSLNSSSNDVSPMGAECVLLGGKRERTTGGCTPVVVKVQLPVEMPWNDWSVDELT